MMPYFSQIRIFCLLATIICCFGVSGCATNNEFLLRSRLFPRRSDKIPGLMPPKERTNLIREKGKMGANAPKAEKDILVSQLLTEYRDSPDPNLRREAIDALSNIPHPQRIDSLKEGLNDESASVRTAAIVGIANKKIDNSAHYAEIAHILRNAILQDPDTNVRVNAIRLLGEVPSPNKTKFQRGDRVQDVNFELLGQLLSDKSIVIRHEATKSLGKYTGKDYGVDITRWEDYYRFQTGGSEAVPTERTTAEKMPKPQLRMFR